MYYAKQNKSIRERQISYDFIHMWNLRNKVDHKGNTNQNHVDTTSHLSEWLKLKTQETTSVGEDVEKKQLACTVRKNANCTATVENSMEVPQKVKNRTNIFTQ